jgi:hypothetical protein
MGNRLTGKTEFYGKIKMARDRRTKRVCSSVLALLMLSGVLVVSGLPALTNLAHAQQAPVASNVPAGLPSYSTLVTRGNYFVSLVQSSPKYRVLSNGTTFYADPYTSFGFSSGPVKQDDYEIITLYSSNRESYIRADINNATNAIIDMSFTNLNSTARVFSSSPNTIGFTGNICVSTNNCENINSNNNAGLVGTYIVHNTQDTTTSAIPSNGNSWTEAWDSPGT